MSDDKPDSEKPSRPPFVAVLISIFPPPVHAADEFTLTALSATESYSVDPPIVVGQYPWHGAQSLTVLLRIKPAPPPPPSPIVRAPPRSADGWPEEPAAFATALRKARQEAGITQHHLAQLAGYSEVTIYNIETNRHGSSAESRRCLIAALAKARNSPPSHKENQRRATRNPPTPDAERTDEPRKNKP